MGESRLCPVCKVNLEARSMGDTKVDVCPKCAGMFFDAHELMSVKNVGFEETDSAFSPTAVVEQPKGPLNCPQCGTAMEPYRYQYTSPLTLDSCPACEGIWIDDEELRQMAEFSRQKTDESAAVRAAAVVDLEARTSENLSRARAIRRVFGLLTVRSGS